MNLCNQKFQGPLSLDAPGIQDGTPGVFAIVCDCKDGRKRIVDAGNSAALHLDLTNSDNLQRWRKAYDGPLCLYVWYSPQPDNPPVRESLARALIERYRPWCRR